MKSQTASLEEEYSQAENLPTTNQLTEIISERFGM